MATRWGTWWSAWAGWSRRGGRGRRGFPASPSTPSTLPPAPSHLQIVYALDFMTSWLPQKPLFPQTRSPRMVHKERKWLRWSLFNSWSSTHKSCFFLQFLLYFKLCWYLTQSMPRFCPPCGWCILNWVKEHEMESAKKNCTKWNRPKKSTISKCCSWCSSGFLCSQSQEFHLIFNQVHIVMTIMMMPMITISKTMATLVTTIITMTTLNTTMTMMKIWAMHVIASRLDLSWEIASGIWAKHGI